jgi:hypothetical protein
MGFSLALVVAALMGGFAAPAPITKVSVRDDQFQVVKVLAPAELAEFRRQWESKREVETSLSRVGGQHVKLDIERQDSQGRWLYRTTGYVQLLSKQAKPVYKLQDPATFNRLIGAEK